MSDGLRGLFDDSEGEGEDEDGGGDAEVTETEIVDAGAGAGESGGRGWAARLLRYAVAGLGLIGFGGGWLYLGLHIGMWPLLINSGVFVFGLAFLPLVAYVIGPSLPHYLSEPLAKLLMILGNAGRPAAALNYDEHDEYDIGDADPEDVMGDDGNWTHFAGTRFGVTYDAAPEAFGDAAPEDDPREDHEPPSEVGGKEAAILTRTKREVDDLARGGYRAFIDMSARARDADFLVKTGEFLSQLETTSGLRETQEAQERAMEEFGGDTSGHSPKIRLAGMVVFSLIGIGMGVVFL